MLIMHFVGFVIGVGGATASDVMFLRSIKDKKISDDELGLIKTVSYVVIMGLVIVIISGLFLFLQNTTLLSSVGFQIKMTVVLLLTINGTLFHIYALPLMKKYLNDNFANEEIKNKLWIFVTMGGVSVVSWYSALVLGIVMRWIELPYLFLLSGYILLILGAIFFAYIMLSRIIFSGEKMKLTKFPMFIALGAILLAFVFGGQAYALFLNTEKEQKSEIVKENVIEFEMRVLENEWKWDPDQITVPAGSFVRLNLFNEDFYAHGFAIKELDIDVYLSAKKTMLIEFTADLAPGEYEFYCSVLCGQGHFDQIGKLIVTE